MPWILSKSIATISAYADINSHLNYSLLPPFNSISPSPPHHSTIILSPWTHPSGFNLNVISFKSFPDIPPCSFTLYYVSSILAYCSVVCLSQIILAHQGQLRTFIFNFIFSNHTLEAWNWPIWKYLNYIYWRKLQIRASFPISSTTSFIVPTTCLP